VERMMNSERFTLKMATIFLALDHYVILNERMKKVCVSWNADLVESQKNLVQIRTPDFILDFNIEIYKQDGDKGAKIIYGFYSFCKNKVIFSNDFAKNLFFDNFDKIFIVIGINFSNIIFEQDVYKIIKELMYENDFVFDGAYVMNHLHEIIARPK
jgi:hypothetical protein